MFGIGGGEIIFIMFIALMLFGSDKVPEIARTVGKTMAQIKNATNEIKSEIQKGAEANGLDKQSLADLTGSINAEIDKAKESLIGDSRKFKDFSNSVNSEINQVNKELSLEEDHAKVANVAQDDTLEGPIKRQM